MAFGIVKHVCKSDLFCFTHLFQFVIRWRRFSSCALLVFCMAAPILYSSSISAKDTLVDAQVNILPDCRISVDVDRQGRDVLLVFREEYLNLSEQAPDLETRSDGFTLPHESIEYLLKPDRKKILMAVGSEVNGKVDFSVLNYDPIDLASRIAECHSPDAPALSVEEIQQQADELNITLDDYMKCPCGEALASVEMSTPPWNNDNFRFTHGSNSCQLVAADDEKKIYDSIQAGGSKGAKSVNCWARVGLTAESGRVDSRAPNVEYSSETLQACYNIISAKARQYVAGGGSIELIYDPWNDSKRRETLVGDLDNLNCPAG